MCVCQCTVPSNNKHCTVCVCVCVTPSPHLCGQALLSSSVSELLCLPLVLPEGGHQCSVLLLPREGEGTHTLAPQSLAGGGSGHTTGIHGLHVHVHVIIMQWHTCMQYIG